MPETINSTAPIVGYCRNCGRPLSAETSRNWLGIPHCEECAETLKKMVEKRPPSWPVGEPAAFRPSETSRLLSGTGSGSEPNQGTDNATQQPAAAPHPTPVNGPSPVLAAILGFIPGLGAVYNGQYVKGILHVVIFGTLMSINVSPETGGLLGLFIPLTVLFWIYMPIEAYRTARSMERGEPVSEFSGLLAVFQRSNQSPAGGILLIILGVFFLLHTLGYWRLADAVRFWPVLLILVGVYTLYRSVVDQARERDRAEAARPGPLRSFLGHEDVTPSGFSKSSPTADRPDAPREGGTGDH